MSACVLCCSICNCCSADAIADDKEANAADGPPVKPSPGLLGPALMAIALAMLS